MEIQIITLENWMCRICLGKGTHSIFKDRLIGSSIHQLPSHFPLAENHQGQPTMKVNRSGSSILIIDALNYFSDFKIVKPDAVNEPVMLCDSCYAELIRCIEFRKKLNDSEMLLREDRGTSDIEEKNEEMKTGLTMQMVDIAPFLEEDDPASPTNYEEETRSSKIHAAKPRFQLTSQVSSILRHVTATRNNSSSGSAVQNLSTEKRKDLGNQSDSDIPKKSQRRCSPQAQNTVIEHDYIFNSEKWTKAHNIKRKEINKFYKPKFIQLESKNERGDTGEIFHCKYCSKAFSTAQLLANHTKYVHSCLLCQKHFPTALAKEKHKSEDHRWFRCSLCVFKCRYPLNLETHLRIMHPIASPVGDVQDT